LLADRLSRISAPPSAPRIDGGAGVAEAHGWRLARVCRRVELGNSDRGPGSG